MAVVKNIAELNEEELKKFKEFYVTYFRKEYVESNVKHPHLCKINLYLMARRYAEIVIGDIKAGHTTGFASFDFDFETKRDGIALVPSGLIIGYDTGEGTNNLMHLFVAREPQSYPRLIILRDLFASYSEVAKNNGSFYVQTSSDLFDPRLTSDLNALSFDRVCTDGTEEVYKKSI